MAGTDPIDGKVLHDIMDIQQSLGTIMTTPRGSRVMRRDFGYAASEIIDSPANPRGIMQIIAAMADAITLWEPRVRLTSIAVKPAFDGSAVIHATTAVKSNGLTITQSVGFGGGL